MQQVPRSLSIASHIHNNTKFVSNWKEIQIDPSDAYLDYNRNNGVVFFLFYPRSQVSPIQIEITAEISTIWKDNWDFDSTERRFDVLSVCEQRCSKRKVPCLYHLKKAEENRWFRLSDFCETALSFDASTDSFGNHKESDESQFWLFLLLPAAALAFHTEVMYGRDENWTENQNLWRRLLEWSVTSTLCKPISIECMFLINFVSLFYLLIYIIPKLWTFGSYTLCYFLFSLLFFTNTIVFFSLCNCSS